MDAGLTSPAPWRRRGCREGRGRRKGRRRRAAAAKVLILGVATLEAAAAVAVAVVVAGEARSRRVTISPSPPLLLVRPRRQRLGRGPRPVRRERRDPHFTTQIDPFDLCRRFCFFRVGRELGDEHGGIVPSTPTEHTSRDYHGGDTGRARHENPRGLPVGRDRGPCLLCPRHAKDAPDSPPCPQAACTSRGEGHALMLRGAGAKG